MEGSDLVNRAMLECKFLTGFAVKGRFFAPDIAFRVNPDKFVGL